MRRRLLTAILLVAALAVIGFGLPLGLSVQALYRDEARLMLSEEAARAAVAVPASFARDKDLPELPETTGDVQVALYGADGRRVLGSGPARADAAVTAALRGGPSQLRRSDLVVAFPISEEEVVVGAIRASISADVVASRTHRTWAAMSGLALLVLVAAGLLAARRSSSLARPLAQLRTDADLLGAGGELDIHPSTGIVEIDAVHAALAEAATRLQGALARERSFSADLAHQLRTPLASLRLRLEIEQHQRANSRPFLGEALKDVDRLQQTIVDLLELARDTGRTRERHPLATLLREAGARWQPRMRAAGRPLEVSVQDHLPWVEASPPAVRQILDVLLDNALTHGSGKVRLSGSRVGQGAIAAVTDEGPAVVDADEIFVRRGSAATGSGIGLALARRLAEAEDMRLVLAHPGPGLVFHLAFVGSSMGTQQGRQQADDQAPGRGAQDP